MSTIVVLRRTLPLSQNGSHERFLKVEAEEQDEHLAPVVILVQRQAYVLRQRWRRIRIVGHNYGNKPERKKRRYSTLKHRLGDHHLTRHID